MKALAGCGGCLVVGAIGGLMLIIALFVFIGADSAKHPARVVDAHHAKTFSRDSRAAAHELDEAIEGYNELSHTRLYRGSTVSGEDAAFSVDRNVWDTLSTQDQETTFNGMGQLWAKVYARYHGNMPGKSTIRFFDLNGQQIKWDVFSKDD